MKCRVKLMRGMQSGWGTCQDYQNPPAPVVLLDDTSEKERWIQSKLSAISKTPNLIQWKISRLKGQTNQCILILRLREFIAHLFQIVNLSAHFKLEDNSATCHRKVKSYNLLVHKLLMQQKWELKHDDTKTIN